MYFLKLKLAIFINRFPDEKHRNSISLYMANLKNAKEARVYSVQSCQKNNGRHYKIHQIRTFTNVNISPFNLRSANATICKQHTRDGYNLNTF